MAGQEERPVELAVLSDNQTLPGFASEWGLAVAVRRGGTMGLWDTGASRLFLDNARRLGLDLSQAAWLALSHSHYDHTGGVAALVETGFAGIVTAHPSVLRETYSCRPGKPVREIGAPRDCLPILEDRLVPVLEAREIAPGVTFATGLPRSPEDPGHTGWFYADALGSEPDTVPDDAYLVIETPAGTVLLLGCCHAGLSNTFVHAREKLGIESVHAVVGGLHLYEAETEGVRRAAALLEEAGVKRVIVGHCTGEGAVRELAEALPGRVEPLAAGQRLFFG